MSFRRDWWALLLLIIAGILGGALATLLVPRPAQAADPPSYAKVVETQAVRIVDAQGNARAVLSTAEGFVALLMFSRQGKLALQLTVDKRDNPSAFLHGPAGNRLIMLGVEAGNPAVAIFDPEGKVRGEVTLLDGIVAARYYGPGDQKTPRAVFASLKDGKSALFFQDQKGKPVWVAP